MTDCIFCKIVAGTIPGVRVYEDEHILGILDITPVRPGHVLLLTKEHYDRTDATPDAELAALAAAAKRVGKGLSAIGAGDFNIMVNSGAGAGQVIMHTHWHIIPRRAGDGLELWHGSPLSADELAAVGERIRSALA